MKKEFRQAAIGNTQRALDAIRQDAVNLAVWRDPLSPETKKYLEKLPLRKLAAQGRNQDNYCFRLYDSVVVPDHMNKILLQTLSVLPESKGRESLVMDTIKLAEAFTRATGAPPEVAHLLVFKPAKDGPGFWHVDDGNNLGIITLKGDTGTLWRPDESLPADVEDRCKTYWGNVKPETEHYIQQLARYDFAIFKCNKAPNPLVHATPPRSMTRSYRMALLLAN